jgi:hypothetical protein
MVDELAPGEWVGHPYTNKLRGHFQAELNQARLELMSAARASTDVEVRKEAVKVDLLMRFIAHLQGGDLTKERT